MTAFVACCSHWLRLIPGLACLAFAVMALPHPAVAADAMPKSTIGEPVTVHLDQAKILKTPERTATIVVGNPLIADVAVQPGGIMIVTAKSYGVTNVVALDRSGNTLMEHPIQVLGPNENVIVVYRGIDRESYSCAPDCARRIAIGDAPGYFNANLTQASVLNSTAGQPPK